MDIFIAIILGIIEGITEFLPVSSTGHLIVAENLMGFQDSAKVFTVVVQFGAILAAAWYFRHDLMAILKGILNKDRQMIVFVRNVLFGLIPSLVIGLFVEKTIGLPDSLVLIALSLIIGGIIFLIIESRVHRSPAKNGDVRYEEITVRRSWQIGLGQCLALIPGVSRSGATIMTGLVAGLDRKTATVFSFYLSIPVMLGASIVKLLDDYSAIESISGGVPALIAGMITSFISALVVIKWLLRYVQTHTFKPFAYYRIGLGTAILIVLAVYN
jgi:undecaprenyl-diphosphatase